ncbi:hypothetical protein J2S13_002671 [Oikeobacillus pervagus]|uniref:DUF4097 domain-containing protein n=1 Tax=Oikeobacillus pervagus TaxID=1325931 RepID=A0AAJ1T6U4_9BACI|nr:DUF4097 family beta strand repeat-containing protein [Oikeobacillus pervagus]MDQ0216231.1 hypothetical protein [Oikeobacillus pervagus]
MTLLVLGLLNSFKSSFEYQSNIKNVNGIILNSDFSNIKVVSADPDLYIDFQGQETIFGEPNIDITYSEDKAVINVLTFNKGWKKTLPGKRKRSEILLNIPPGFLDEIHLRTKNGNIDVDQVVEVSRLSLISDVGMIRMNSFQGELLNIESGNGSINLGEVNGQINIKNKVGNLKSLTLRSVKGENTIKISNGNVKVQLPKETKTDDIGLNISTKNGKIVSKEYKLNIINKGPGKKVLKNVPNSEAKLNISVFVGNIEIN